MSTLWDNEAKRLRELAQAAAHSAITGRFKWLWPYDRDDLVGELVVYALDTEAQKARGVYVTPDLENGLLVSRLNMIGDDWFRDHMRGSRAEGAKPKDLFGHRLTWEETDELGVIRKVGKALPNEGREFIERVLGNPDADPGHRRLMDRALGRMCQGEGRQNRSDLIYRKFVQKEKLKPTDSKQLTRLVEELTENLNACLIDVVGVQFEESDLENLGTGEFKIGKSPVIFETDGLGFDGDGGPEPQPLLDGEQWMTKTKGHTITREEYRRTSPKRAASYDSYVAQRRVGRVALPPKTTPQHQYY